jgi:HK97 gp10 family phage protein
VSVTITGDKVLERRLKKLPANVQRNLARKSMRKALNILKKEAKESAPVRTGRLKKSITTKVSMKRSGVFEGRLYSRSRGKLGAPHSNLVEWGGVNNKPSRFMTRVFERNKENVIDEFRKILKEEILKAGKL